MPIVATAVAGVAATWSASPSQIVTVGADGVPGARVRRRRPPVTTPLASIVAVPVACTPPGRFGQGELDDRLDRVAAAAVDQGEVVDAAARHGRRLEAVVGLPPVMVTTGAVKPKPDSFTAMLVTHPSEIAAVAPPATSESRRGA